MHITWHTLDMRSWLSFLKAVNPKLTFSFFWLTGTPLISSLAFWAFTGLACELCCSHTVLWTQGVQLVLRFTQRKKKKKEKHETQDELTWPRSGNSLPCQNLGHPCKGHQKSSGRDGNQKQKKGWIHPFGPWHINSQQFRAEKPPGLQILCWQGTPGGPHNTQKGGRWASLYFNLKKSTQEKITQAGCMWC